MPSYHVLLGGVWAELISPTQGILCPAEAPSLSFIVNFSIASALREREVDHIVYSPRSRQLDTCCCCRSLIASCPTTQAEESHMTSPSYPSAIPEKLSKRASGFSIVLSVLLIVCGVRTILSPFEMSLGVVLLVSWLLIIGGIVQFVHVRCAIKLRAPVV